MPSTLSTPLTLAITIGALAPVAAHHDEHGSTGGGGSSAIWYVDADAPGLDDGSSWENAFLSPHGALAVASEGDEIRVAQGTYRPEPPDGDQEVSFRLVSGVALLGGFAGYGEPDPDERDVARFRTILSGDLNRDDPISGRFYTGSTERQDNSLHVLFGQNLRQTTVVDGFRIFGGNAGRGTGWPIGMQGGAIYAASSAVTFRDCILDRNASSLFGGAIRVVEGSDLTLTNCRLIDNVSNYGGAISTYGRCNIAVHNCELRMNLADGGWGGAVNLEDYGSNLELSNCVFTENTADRAGAVEFHGSILLATNCIFDGNESLGSTGGLNVSSNAYVVLTNARFTNNRSGSAGGAYLSAGGGGRVSRITNCTFSRNQARYLTGAGLLVSGGPFVITNSIFHGNRLNGEGGEIAQVDIDGYAEMEINVSTVEGWTGRFDGWGSTGLDPQFIDVEGGDFRLSPGSPVIDAGDNSAVPFGVETDVAGNPRFVDDPMTEDTGIQNCPSVDLGAYEFQAEGGCCARRPRWVCDADVDGDGQVNPVDVGLVQAAFGATSEQDLCNYDLDCDGRINPVDSGIVQSSFGTCEVPRDVCP